MAGAGAGATARALSTSSASSRRAESILREVEEFIEKEVIPVEKEVLAQGYKGGEDSWKEHEVLEVLKEKARAKVRQEEERVPALNAVRTYILLHSRRTQFLPP